MSPREGGHFAPVAAHGHGTPTPPASPRRVVEEEPAMRIGTNPQPCPRAFGNDFRTRAGHGGQQPLEAPFPGNEFERPLAAISGLQFVVPIRDPQDLVHLLDPLPRYFLSMKYGGKCVPKSSPESQRLAQQGLSGLRIGVGESEQFAGALRGCYMRSLQ